MKRIKKQWRVIPVDTIEPGMRIREDDSAPQRVIKTITEGEGGIYTLTFIEGGSEKMNGWFNIEYLERKVVRTNPIISALIFIAIGMLALFFFAPVVYSLIYMIKFIGDVL